MDGFVRNIGTCGVCGKHLFITKRQAKEVIRRMLSNGIPRSNELGSPLRPYLSCDGTAYHVGHSRSWQHLNLNDSRLRHI